MRLLSSLQLLRMSFRCFSNPRRNKVANIETKVLWLITFLVVHLPTRCDGITKVCETILAQLNHNCSRMLVSSLMAWRSIQILERSEYDEACLTPVSLSTTTLTTRSAAVDCVGRSCQTTTSGFVCKPSSLRNMHRHLVFSFCTQSRFRHEQVQLHAGQVKFSSFHLSTHALFTVACMVLQCTLLYCALSTTTSR